MSDAESDTSRVIVGPSGTRHVYGDGFYEVSFPLTPPVTPPNKYQAYTSNANAYSAPPRYFVKDSSPPPSPTIIIQAPPPWWTSKTIPCLLLALLGFCSFTVHQFMPIITSTASTLDNFGNVVGSVANVGNAFGNSVSTTTRISAGIADGVGDVWCSVFGGSKCANRTSTTTAKGEMQEPDGLPEVLNAVGSTRALLEGVKVVESLRELSMVKSDLTTSAEMLYLSTYLSQAPLVQDMAQECSHQLRLASPAFFENYRARNQALSRSFVVLQGLVDQYNTAVIVSESSSSPFSLPSVRRDALVAELNAMASYTFHNAELARAELHALLMNSRELYGVGTRVVGDLRKGLSMLNKRRMLHPLWEGVCWFGFCKVKDLDWSIELLGEAVGVLEGPIREAGLMIHLSEQVMNEMENFMAAFNATAAIKTDSSTGEVAVGTPMNPWLTMQRLRPALSALSLRLGNASTN